MDTNENVTFSSLQAWSYESSLASMPASRLAARMLDLINARTGESLVVSVCLPKEAAPVLLGDAARYFFVLDLLDIALEYANVTGCLRIRFSLAAGSATPEEPVAQQALSVCFLWDDRAERAGGCAQHGHRFCSECTGTVPFSDYSEAESMQQSDAKASTIMSGNEEVGLQISWPVRKECAEDPPRLLHRQNRPTALLLDHDPARLEYLRMILEDGGFAIESALSGDAAVELVRSRTEAIHLAVINANPMYFAASEIVRALREESPTTRVILTSDCGHQEITSGLHGYPLMLEPISRLQLLAVASKAVAAKNVRADRPGVLIADDEPAIRGLIRMALAAEGYEIIEASNGDEAALALQCHDIDVVVLDLVMPDREGLETIRSIKKKITPVSVVAMSGASKECLLIAKHLGADILLKKPLIIQELVDSVKLALAVKAERMAKPQLDSWSVPYLCRSHPAGR